MSLAGNQARTFLRLLTPVSRRWRTDQALPRFIQAQLAGERRFGSRDRRLYRELLYTAVRYLPWIEPVLEREPDEAVRRVAWLAADLPSTHAFRAAFATGSPPPGNPTELLPAWFRAECPEAFASPEVETLQRRAPLWLRLQTDASGLAAVTAEFRDRGWSWTPSGVLPDAWQLHEDVDLTRTEAWTSGKIEVQDLGSQLLLETIGIAPGGRWLDACAGAGGKSLQLGRLLGGSGHVDAHDIRPAALDELRTRAERSGARTVRVLPGSPAGTYDGVLVDAPCSGSGTWRRAPHLKWTTTPAVVAERAQLQRTLLARFAPFVGKGGRLVYATCSLCRQENEDVVAAFLHDHPNFRPEAFARTFDLEPRGAGLLVFPSRHDTDGFFVASLRRH